MTFHHKVENNQPLVSEFFQILEKRDMFLKDIAKKSGYDRATIYNWRYGTMPRVNSLEDVLNVLGYKLKVVRIDE